MIISLKMGALGFSTNATNSESIRTDGFMRQAVFGKNVASASRIRTPE